ncbi:MAG: prenyltransferase/squalene oxidase repeat-containing protein [Planctomycetaceae bacterium]|nr:terpene cyclase/mutase family protein [Planctomycetaceae bacterium]
MAKNKRRQLAATWAAAAAAVLAAVLATAWPEPASRGTARAAAPSTVLPDMVDRATVAAIEKGMNYLAKTQRRDGSWLNSGGYGVYPCVMTSLAGIALMAGGSNPQSGPHSREVSRAMNYVLRLAEANDDGLIVGQGAESRSMYGHGFGMLFLAQCYGNELQSADEARLKKVLDKAVALTVKSQSDLGAPLKNAGGWIYTPTGQGDEGSVTVTQLQALRACRNAGIKVPKETIDRAVAYLKHCQMPDGGICYSAQSRGSSRPPISAAAIACFYAAGVYDRTAGGGENEMVERLVKYCKGKMDSSETSGHYFYAHFYYAQGMYHRGGNDWKDYYPKISKMLIERQAPDGSWNGDSVGTTYGTAIATIILQLPYGYLPICQK